MTQQVLRRTLGAAVAAWLATAGLGCVAAKNLLAPDGNSSVDSSTIATAMTMCVTQVNELRASVGLGPLTESKPIDDFSTQAAKVDGEAHEAHKYFLQTNGGPGIAVAENVIPWWKMSDWGSVENVVYHGVNQMWAEGPSGYHYVNMTGRYNEMGCGIAVINGEVTVSQNFK